MTARALSRAKRRATKRLRVWRSRRWLHGECGRLWDSAVANIRWTIQEMGLAIAAFHLLSAQIYGLGKV